jgi:hypothetical protein
MSQSERKALTAQRSSLSRIAVQSLLEFNPAGRNRSVADASGRIGEHAKKEFDRCDSGFYTVDSGLAAM